MLYLQNNPITRFRERLKLRKVAKLVRAGIPPKGVDRETIYKALALTRRKNVTEAFGILCARQFRNGNLIEDFGVVGVREVTSEFADYMVDALQSSTVVFDDFAYHAMGSGSTAETSSHAALVAQEGSRVAGTQGWGSTSNIYETVATMTASTTFEAAEHGVFDSATATSDVMLDRTLVGSPPNLVTGDEVEWTYQLTVNAGG